MYFVHIYARFCSYTNVTHVHIWAAVHVYKHCFCSYINNVTFVDEHNIMCIYGLCNTYMNMYFVHIYTRFCSYANGIHVHIWVQMHVYKHWVCSYINIVKFVYKHTIMIIYGPIYTYMNMYAGHIQTRSRSYTNMS